MRMRTFVVVVAVSWVVVYNSFAGVAAEVATDDGAGLEGNEWAESVLYSGPLLGKPPYKDCPAREPQVDANLAHYPVITKSLFERALQPYYAAHAVHYLIKDRVLYAAPTLPGAVVGVRQFIEPFLLRLLELTDVPDVEFLLNMSDYPQGRKYRERGKPATDDPVPPIISMCGSENMLDIVMPTYKMTHTAVGRGQPDVVRTSAWGNIPWEQRKEQLVWRGSDSNRDRFKVNLLANSPEYEESGLFNIGINSMVRVKHQPEVHGPVKPTLTFPDFFSHKWVFNVDGSVAAYRMPYLIAGGSLLIKQDSQYYEHFYHELVPWKHYVPVKHDFSDLLEKTKWAKEHDAEAKKMGEELQKFALKRLTNEMNYCYMNTLLREYAARMDYVPQIREGMTVVTK